MSRGSRINSSDTDMGIVDNNDMKSCSVVVDTIKDGNVDGSAKPRFAEKLVLPFIVGDMTTSGTIRDGEGAVVGGTSVGVGIVGLAMMWVDSINPAGVSLGRARGIAGSYGPTSTSRAPFAAVCSSSVSRVYITVN